MFLILLLKIYKEEQVWISYNQILSYLLWVKSKLDELRGQKAILVISHKFESSMNASMWMDKECPECWSSFYGLRGESFIVINNRQDYSCLEG